MYSRYNARYTTCVSYQASLIAVLTVYTGSSLRLYSDLQLCQVSTAWGTSVASLITCPRLKMCRYPTAYADLLKLGRERAGALYLDLGCCVGNDLRKAVADGFPVSQVLACDLHPGMALSRRSSYSTDSRTCAEFWEMGHKLFKTTPETFPVPFIQADVFDTACLAPLPFPSAPPPEPLPPLATLQTLTSLSGSLSAIHTSSFFHLFSEDQQLQLARLIAPLLRPEPGSMIFGGHVGLPARGFHHHKNTHGIQMFCHSPGSWKEMWAQVFHAGAVRVEAHLEEFTRMHPAIGEAWGNHLVWSVTRT